MQIFVYYYYVLYYILYCALYHVHYCAFYYVHYHALYCVLYYALYCMQILLFRFLSWAFYHRHFLVWHLFLYTFLYIFIMHFIMHSIMWILMVRILFCGFYYMLHISKLSCGFNCVNSIMLIQLCRLNSNVRIWSYRFYRVLFCTNYCICLIMRIILHSIVRILLYKFYRENFIIRILSADSIVRFNYAFYYADFYY